MNGLELWLASSKARNTQVFSLDFLNNFAETDVKMNGYTLKKKLFLRF